MAELSTKPYLIRAIHEWCTDSGMRPHIAVLVDEHTIVPREFVRAGEIVLNISSLATNRLQITNEMIEFEARFGGQARRVSIPIENVSAIYAQETGQGMAFDVPKPLALAPEPVDVPAETEPDTTPTGQATVHPMPGRRRKPGPAESPAATTPASDGAPDGSPTTPVARTPRRRRRPTTTLREATSLDEAKAARPRLATDPDAASGGSVDTASDASPDATPDARPDGSPEGGTAGAGAGGAARNGGNLDRKSPAKPQYKGDSSGRPDAPDDDPPPRPPVGRPRLTRVK